ncbi:MAG: phosphotriesterase [Sporomusaceae bacterium]|nr:phosphotriesterase [Sporomusaceae bacterium]
MAAIMTVCGPVTPEELGFTSMHEHILSDCSMFGTRSRKPYFVPPFQRIRPGDRLALANRSAVRHDIVSSLDNMRLDDEAVMLAEVAAFKAGGGNSIVETSAPGIRAGDADLIALTGIARKSGVHIIASTGLYAEDTWPAQYRTMTQAQYVRFLQQEIQQGIGGSGILPGHIKAAYEAPSPQVDAYLRAAAFVSGSTGVSLQVHLGPDVTADAVRSEVVAPLLAGGCIPGKTILCHVQYLLGVLSLDCLINQPGQVPFNLGLLEELLAQGFVLSFTPLGFEADNELLGLAHYPDWYALAGMAALIRQGYAGQLVAGNDVFTKLATLHGGGDGYRRLTDFIVPALRQCGIIPADVEKIFFENPARILAF